MIGDGALAPDACAYVPALATLLDAAGTEWGGRLPGSVSSSSSSSCVVEFFGPISFLFASALRLMDPVSAAVPATKPTARILSKCPPRSRRDAQSKRWGGVGGGCLLFPSGCHAVRAVKVCAHLRAGGLRPSSNLDRLRCGVPWTVTGNPARNVQGERHGFQLPFHHR